MSMRKNTFAKRDLKYDYVKTNIANLGTIDDEGDEPQTEPSRDGSDDSSKSDFNSLYNLLNRVMERRDGDDEKRNDGDGKVESEELLSNDCPVCGTPMIIDDKGILVCPNCGIVGAQVYGELSESEVGLSYTSGRTTKIITKKRGRKPKHGKVKKISSGHSREERGALHREIIRLIDNNRAVFPTLNDIIVPRLNQRGSNYTNLKTIFDSVTQIIGISNDFAGSQILPRARRPYKIDSVRHRRLVMRDRIVNLINDNQEILGDVQVPRLNARGTTTSFYESIYRDITRRLRDRQVIEPVMEEKVELDADVSADLVRINELVQNGIHGESISVDFPNLNYTYTLFSKIQYPNNVTRFLKVILKKVNEQGDVSRNAITINNLFLGNLLSQINQTNDYSDEQYDGILQDLQVAYGAEFIIVDSEGFNVRQERNGAYFIYRHLTELDLKDIQIYKADSDEVDDEMVNCLIGCLKYYGYEDNAIAKVAKYVINGHVPKSKLKSIANDLNCTIKLYYQRKSETSTVKNRVDYYNKLAKGELLADKPQLDLCLIENHYFPLIDIEVTSFALKNYNLVKDLPEWNKIVGFKKGSGKPQRANGKTLNSLQVVQLMLENKEMLLRKITGAELMDRAPKEYKVKELFPEDSEYVECEYKERIADYTGYLAFDTEASSNGVHQVYCAAMTVFDYSTIISKMSADGPNCIEELFYRLPKNEEKEVFCSEKGSKALKKMPYLCYVHNLKYDLSFIKKYLTCVDNIIRTNGRTLSITGYVSGKLVEFRDSYAIINKPLKKFSEMFQITVEKEVMPYRAYTDNTITKKTMNLKMAMSKLDSMKNKAQFKTNLEKLGLITDDGESFDHIRYALHYCTIDTEVLAEGILRFREMLCAVTGLDVFNYITLASVATAHLMKEHCFQGCYQMSGITRDYIQKCVVGGRCQLRFNEKFDLQIRHGKMQNVYKKPKNVKNEMELPKDLTKRVIKDYVNRMIQKEPNITLKQLMKPLREKYPKASKKEIKKVIINMMVKKQPDQKIKALKNELNQDFDACGLYPSSMYSLGEMGGFLMGTPVAFRNQNMTGVDDLDNLIMEYAELPKVVTYSELCKKDGYFIKINLKNQGKVRAFPVISNYRNNRRNWDNATDGIVYVDKITLNDLIQFHGVDPDNDFDILDGYYFDQGRNNKISEMIKHLYETRAVKKKEGNPVQEIYKLLMNSSYGRTIMKPIKNKYQIVDSTDELNKLIVRNHNKMSQSVQIKGTDRWLVTTIESTEKHFSLPQVGAEILSMSKHIMNEVMCLAEDIGCDIWLQDTDSMHIKQKDIDKLTEAYRLKYGRKLIGKQMGQFHSDFEDIKINGKSYKTLGAIRSIGIGKKCYYDKLVGYDEESNEIVYGEHYRMKGIPQAIIIETAKEMNITVEQIYEKLLEGETITFDLAKYNHIPSFAFEKDGTVLSRVKFERRIKF